MCEMVGSLAKVEETKAMYGTYIIYIILCVCVGKCLTLTYTLHHSYNYQHPPTPTHLRIYKGGGNCGEI